VTEFATVAQIETLTGVTVTEGQRSRAAVVIELTTGLIEGTLAQRPDTTDRDLYWLRVACAYQAAWMQAQPDFLTRNDVSAMSVDGESATGKPDWLALAPLARRAIKRLSWRGTRTAYTEPTLRDVEAAKLRHALDDAGDELGRWEPIG